MTKWKTLTRYDGVEVQLNIAHATQVFRRDQAGFQPGTIVIFDRENQVLVKEPVATVLE